MRGVKAFLVWLFSFWTWFKAFFGLRWLKTPPLDQARLDTSLGVDQVRSNEGHHESELTTFLSSLSDDKSGGLSYSTRGEDGFQLLASGDGSEREFLGDEPTHREFLAAVASSKVASCESISINDLRRGRNFDIVGALVSNNNFKIAQLSLSDCSALRMAECVSNLLLGNKAIENLEAQLGSKEVVGKEAAEHENRVLKELDLSMVSAGVEDEGMEVLMKPLKENDSVLQHLRFGRTTDLGLEHLGVMLGTNTSLKQLTYWDSHRVDDPNRRDEVYMRGYTSLKEALCINRSLEYLDCTITSNMELKVLLEPLMPMNNNPQANTTLTTLSLSSSRIGGKEGVDILVDMIRTNTSLLNLKIFDMKELGGGSPDAVENAVAILEALKTNKSLKRVSLRCCGGVGGYKVLGTMMDLLLVNQQLEQIDLFDTLLESSGDAEYVRIELEKRKKMKLWDLIKGMANVNPITGRVFLCGDPCAGKTILRKSMKELPEFQNKRDFRNKGSLRLSLSHNRKEIYDKIQIQKVPKASKEDMEINRTRGIEVDTVNCDGIDISIWDMAGQIEYHSFHDLVIPNLSADGSCSLFLLTCNPMRGNPFRKRNISDIKSEIEYWLRFIASNTRRSWLYRPHVSIVMTHFDYWSNEIDFSTRIEDIVEELKLQFQEVLEFDPNRKVFKVDGRDVSNARKVFDFIKAHLRQLLSRLPKTIKACVEVQCLLAEWNLLVSKQLNDVKIPKLPMLKWEELSDKICKGVDELHIDDKELAQRKQEFVAISLNDGGHIMYHEEGRFIITDPHWFCHDIMGEFLHRCAIVDSKLEVVSSHGMISIQHVKRILLDIVGDQGHENMLDEILSMMKKLHVCYEQDDSNFMIPSTLRVKCQSLNWPITHKLAKLTHVGRRLSCKDDIRTMLSLGFFPRLQVSFFKKFQTNNVGNSYQLFEDIIMFICDGIEVIVEFDHVNIDILLRSEQCQDKMLEFLESGIVMHIKDLLLNPTLGCPGVILVEHILRPKCVEDLIGYKDRNNQVVSMKELELEVMTSGFDATHNWKQCVNGSLGTGYDKVKNLLGDEAWKKLLQRRQEALQRYQREVLHTPYVSENSLISIEKRKYAWTSSIWQSTQRLIDFSRGRSNAHWKEVNVKLDNIDKKLDVVIRKVDDSLQMQEDIMKMQHNLLHEVSSRIDDLMEFSSTMQQSQVPKLAYLSEIGKKNLLTRFIPGLMEFQSHLMCESKDGIHEVENQQGCKVNFRLDETRTFVTMLVWGLKIATILSKIGAHVGGGMGGMVPDFGEGLQLSGLILDTPGLLDQMSSLSLKSLTDDAIRSLEITTDDRSKAEAWLIEFLEPKCKEKSTFYDMFKLKKVVYKAVCGKESIAWICEGCERDGIQSGKLYNN